MRLPTIIAPGEATEDTLLGGRVKLCQPRQGLRAGLDAVLLAAAIPARPGQTVLEGGCGSGAVFLCLLARMPDLRVLAVEREPDLAELARHNAALNGWADRVTVLEGDIADPALLRGQPRPDHAFANPPYWPGGTAPPTRLRAGATHAGTGPGLEDWADALAAPLAHKGTLTFVLPAARFAEAAIALRGARCGGVSLLPLWPRAGQPARRVLVQARRHGRQPDHLHPGLVLHDESGWTRDAEAVLRGAAPLAMREA
ncbi:tRNA1(Val) (adenine(37)-N6)-methyltransferase [Roseomonas marmotae]|uniref:Methyltransferase n=1 Tax=Roseomonas marmotae TaxID=2768161 RepID=A0ABS3K8T2_9PROT|nr:methyltransferase domain-containing protein [Roseomonas marmotae]MBO1073874.1 methyltransferase [Roseomonas marmotae]QTI78503.1 methyltransferase [Roseomonas marmotae]